MFLFVSVSVDIDNIPHQRSPHWVHGPQGVAPNDTKFSGDHRISKSPILDNEYNPFSVFSIGKGKGSGQTETENKDTLTLSKLDGHNNTKESPLNKENNLSDELNMSDSQKLKKITMTNNAHSERISIEDLEINNVIPTRPEDNATAAVLKTKKNDEKVSFQTIQMEQNDNISRNSNVTPKAIVLHTDEKRKYTSSFQDFKSRSPEDNNEKKGPQKGNTSPLENDANDNEVANISQKPYRQQILGLSSVNQMRESSMTPILVAERAQKGRGPEPVIDSSRNVAASSGTKIIKANLQKKEIHVSKTEKSGPKEETSPKKKKSNKVVVKSQSMKRSEKPKPQQKSSQSSKSKSKSNKRGHNALNDLIKSKSSGASKNKKGTFYNEHIPTVTEPESYLNISEMNNSMSGICYDDDNEKARALGYWNEDSYAANETTMFEESRIKTPYEMRLALGTTDDRNESRLSLETALSPKGATSTRTLSAITSRIDSRGAKYFIENESSSIVIQVKAEDVPEDFEVTNLTGGNYAKDYQDEEDIEDEEEDEDEDEDEYEDEDEDVEDFDETKEVNKDAVETTMSVLYGTTNEGDDDDPDKMVLTGYEHNLQAIRE